MLSLSAISPLGFASTPHNPCEDAKPYDAQFTDDNGNLIPEATIYGYFENANCAEMMDTGFNINLPQAGMDVTDDGSYGDVNVTGLFEPIMENYADTDLCAVNVHWHKGSEHRSEGQYDENGSGPHPYEYHDLHDRRKLAAGDTRQGMLCHHYDASDAKFTTEYDWQYCEDMEVGQTYEIHWPHSAAGSCGTQWQMQTPFYDGVFCTPGVISLGANPPFNVNQKVGVQGQVFTVVNDDSGAYDNDDLMYAAWQDDTHWVDVAKYVGSTTGTSRDNEVCSFYSPITWQVDRTCHMISARSFDHLCKLMKENAGDDMSADTHPHGSRELVDDQWSSSIVYRKK